MSNSHNHLLPGMYFVLAAIPEIGALPSDFVYLNPRDEVPSLLYRVVDRDASETALSEPGVVRPISGPFSP